MENYIPINNCQLKFLNVIKVNIKDLNENDFITKINFSIRVINLGVVND